MVSIADKAGIKWKDLAKLNHLEPPNPVKKGDNLQVPFKK
jgi:LysM repeat protein